MLHGLVFDIFIRVKVFSVKKSSALFLSPVPKRAISARGVRMKFHLQLPLRHFGQNARCQK